jgi:ferric-dicitrate binding protein FerR (iron transport regulator)
MQIKKIGGLRRLTSAATTIRPARRKRQWRLLLLLGVAGILLAGIWIHNRVENALQHIVADNLQRKPTCRT